MTAWGLFDGQHRLIRIYARKAAAMAELARLAGAGGWTLVGGPEALRHVPDLPVIAVDGAGAVHAYVAPEQDNEE